MQQCRNLCIHFEGYTRGGPTLYRNGIKFCRVCCVGFLPDPKYKDRCGCCKTRLRNKKIRSPNAHKYEKLIA